MGKNSKHSKKKKNQNRQKGKQPKVPTPAFIDNQNVKIGGKYSGVLELSLNNYGFIRNLDFEFSKTDQDPFLTPQEMVKYSLRPGLELKGTYAQDQQGNKHVHSIDLINGQPAEAWKMIPRFEFQTPIMPDEPLKLATGPEDVDMRVVDLIAPIGKGQRALIVAPPRTGKTVLLKKIAHSVDQLHKEVELAILLVDERPEEVTDFMRSTKGRVFASSNDKPTASHIRISELALGFVKRKAEEGRDAVLLIDSLTRLGRAYNAAQTNSGRTLSGGLDIRALEIPKKIFGSARNIEGGGSLTIISTCLVETNSRMDDLIFEEFKGTGNMELVLDRELANDRVFPAINIAASGTRYEDRIIEEGSIEERNMVRRYLLRKSPKESMQSLLQVLRRTKSNQELLNQIAAYS